MVISKKAIISLLSTSDFISILIGNPVLPFVIVFQIYKQVSF